MTSKPAVAFLGIGHAGTDVAAVNGTGGAR